MAKSSKMKAPKTQAKIQIPNQGQWSLILHWMNRVRNINSAGCFEFVGWSNPGEFDLVFELISLGAVSVGSTWWSQGELRAIS